MRAFAGQIDAIEDNDYSIGISEALHTYFLSRWFGFKTLEAAGGAHGLQDALEQAEGALWRAGAKR